jgi:antitoxin FitA
MEEEALEILKAVLNSEPQHSLNLADSIRRRLTAAGGAELSLPPREPVRRPSALGN